MILKKNLSQDLSGTTFHSRKTASGTVHGQSNPVRGLFLFFKKNYTGKRPQTVCRRTSTKDPLRQPPKTSRRDKSQENSLPDICLCLVYTSYLKILCRSHISDSRRNVHQYGSSTRSTSSDSCLNIFVSQAPLQDPCLWIHVSASLYLRILCKIHVSGVSDSCLSIHQNGSSARSTSPDSCLSIFVSQDSLQDPCLRIHVSASTNMNPLQDPRLRIHVSASLYLRLLCKIHVSGSVYQHPYVSQDPLQDPCL